MALYLVDYHDDHVCLQVHIMVEMLCDRRFISPPVCDIISVAVDPAM